jgi:hypothetical protein
MVELLLIISIWFFGGVISVLVFHFTFDGSYDGIEFTIFCFLSLVLSWGMVFFELFIASCYGIIRLINYLRRV